MGGKSLLIVLKDADIDYAVNAAAIGIYFHQGQVCMANSILIVETQIYDAFCERFARKTATCRVGDPREPDTVIGPLIHRSQCGFIDGHVEDATQKNTKVLTGGTHKEQFSKIAARIASPSVQTFIWPRGRKSPSTCCADIALPARLAAPFCLSAHR